MNAVVRLQRVNEMIDIASVIAKVLPVTLLAALMMLARAQRGKTKQPVPIRVDRDPRER